MGFFNKIKEKFVGKSAKQNEKYVAGLDRSNVTFSDRINELAARFREINEDYFEELENILIMSDVGVSMVMKIVDEIKNEVRIQNITDPKQINDIIVDKKATFSDLGNGQYEIRYNDLIIDDNYVTGTINCFVTKDLKFKSIEYNIKTYEPYKKYQLISTKEAYKYIEEGKFNKDYLENVQGEITIRLVRLNYLRDTKGLLQPVYEFVTNGNGIIYVPAIH